jgi:hypothetical protein
MSRSDQTENRFISGFSGSPSDPSVADFFWGKWVLETQGCWHHQYDHGKKNPDANWLQHVNKQKHTNIFRTRINNFQACEIVSKLPKRTFSKTISMPRWFRAGKRMFTVQTDSMHKQKTEIHIDVCTLIPWYSLTFHVMWYAG